MHALPDDLTRLTPEQLLAAYDRTPTGPLYAELLRRLRLVPVPDTPETVAAKCQAARGVLNLFRGQQESP